MARRYLIETFGCQMNVHDSERMAGLLEQAGYERTGDECEADVIVLNTCSVRERAEEKLYTRLGELRQVARHDGLRPVVAVAGCVAQQEGARILKRSGKADVIVGTQAARRLPALVEEARRSATSQIDVHPYDDVSFPLGLARRSDPVKAYVNIIEGCNDFCAFCVVPYTRGRERMRTTREILDEVKEAADTGRREVHLLGQIVNDYRAPDIPGCDFGHLLELVHEVRGIERIRFASPHPRHVTARMIQAMRDLPRVCQHLHLPVQSGSTSVLTRMRRRHTRDEYLDLVHSIRDAMPNIALSTDMIVGFPGETNPDFNDTLTLTQTVRFHGMFSFKYSERPNTLAATRLPDDVSPSDKTNRIVALQTMQRAIQMELHEAAIGSTVDVLADSTSRRGAHELSGRTGGNTVVNFPGPPEWMGRTIRVRIDRAGPNSLSGEPVGT